MEEEVEDQEQPWLAAAFGWGKWVLAVYLADGLMLWGILALDQVSPEEDIQAMNPVTMYQITAFPAMLLLAGKQVLKGLAPSRQFSLTDGSGLKGIVVKNEPHERSRDRTWLSLIISIIDDEDAISPEDVALLQQDPLSAKIILPLDEWDDFYDLMWRYWPQPKP